MPLQIIVVRNLIPQIDMMPLTMDSFASAPSVTNELSNKSSIATDTLALTPSATSRYTNRKQKFTLT